MPPTSHQQIEEFDSVDRNISNQLGLIGVFESVAEEDELAVESIDPHALNKKLLESCASELSEPVVILGQALAVVEMAGGLSRNYASGSGGEQSNSAGYGDWELVHSEFRDDVRRCWTTAIQLDGQCWMQKASERMKGHPEQVIRDFLVEETVFGKVRITYPALSHRPFFLSFF